MEKAKIFGLMFDVFDDTVIPKAVDSTVDIDTSTNILDQLREAHKTYLEEGIVYVVVNNVLFFVGNNGWLEKVQSEFSNLDDMRGVLI